MSSVRSSPCLACPYRRDVPSGVWSAEEYDKLPPYDAETFAQPFGSFACHATPEHLCHGWAVVHSARGHEFDLIALRIDPPDAPIPPAGVELFASGTEAAEHGKRRIHYPGDDAIETTKRLLRKYTRLREAPMKPDDPRPGDCFWWPGRTRAASTTPGRRGEVRWATEHGVGITFINSTGTKSQRIVSRRHFAESARPVAPDGTLPE